MKATGIVRRIDELGRVVIPKEIRRTQRIRQGDALEIFTDADGEVIFKKYSPLAQFRELSETYAEVLSKQLALPVVVCDRETIIAAAGGGRGDYLGQPITTALSRLLGARSVYTAPEASGERVPPCAQGDKVLSCAAPVLVHGDVEGGVCILQDLSDPTPEADRVRAAVVAAAFLARWMEE
ncbi:MAG: stage V sporulation T C-terminal domain-containing protein [Gemmiger sp.]